MLEGKASYYYLHKGYRSLASINISQSVAKDSNFPFKHKDKLKVTINPKDESLTITKEKPEGGGKLAETLIIRSVKSMFTTDKLPPNSTVDYNIEKEES